MKKVLLLLSVILLVSCTKETEYAPGSQKGKSMFVVIENAASWRVICHKETKVMYMIQTAGSSHGFCTLLVDADGKSMVYDSDLSNLIQENDL